MRITLGLAQIFGILFDLASAKTLVIWILDWIGRFDSLRSLGVWGNWVVTSFPWISLLIFLVGMAFIVFGRKWPIKEASVTITPFYAAIFLTIFALGAWGWFYLDWRRGPIIWTFGDGPHPIFGMQGGNGGPPLIWQLQFTGTNRSNGPIENIDGFVRSNLTNKQIPLYFQIGGKFVQTTHTLGIPAHADFMLIAPITGNTPDDARRNEMRADKFLAEYGDITVMIKFSGRGSPFVRHFTKEELSKPLDEFAKSLLEPPPSPSVIPK